MVFFKIGLFGFGGGYGMLSLIQHEVVENNGWISHSEFTDIVAVSQMTPGPIGINSATYVGYTAVMDAGYTQGQAVLGSLVATSAVMLPSFILMLLISIYFMRYKQHPMVQRVLAWLRPVVVGMLAAATLLLLNRENFGTFQVAPKQFVISCALFMATFIATYRYKTNPILCIVLAGVMGGLIYSL